MTVPHLNSLSSLEQPIFSQMFLNGYEILYVYVCKMYREGQVQNSKSIISQETNHHWTLVATNHQFLLKMNDFWLLCRCRLLSL